VTVSSAAIYLTSSLDFDAIADGPGRNKYIVHDMYNKSKFVRQNRNIPNLLNLLTRLKGNVVVARELARRYGDKIVSTSLHPGTVRTELVRHLPWFLCAILVASPP
jgi:retinol dehydrogenase-12